MIPGTCAAVQCCPDCMSSVSPDHTLTEGCCQRLASVPAGGFNPKPHSLALEVPQDFAAVIAASAQKENRTFAEQLLAFAIAGAECERLHKK